MTSSLKDIEEEMENKEKRIKELEEENKKLRDIVGSGNMNGTSNKKVERKPSENTENTSSGTKKESKPKDSEFSGPELLIEAFRRDALK